jgi:hypothetical protein
MPRTVRSSICIADPQSEKLTLSNSGDEVLTPASPEFPGIVFLKYRPFWQQSISMLLNRYRSTTLIGGNRYGE